MRDPRELFGPIDWRWSFKPEAHPWRPIVRLYGAAATGMSTHAVSDRLFWLGGTSILAISAAMKAGA